MDDELSETDMDLALDDGEPGGGCARDDIGAGRGLGVRRAAAEAWVAEALALLRRTCDRRLPAWRRRLLRHGQPRDPIEDLLVLGARRCVRLSGDVRRRLPEAHMDEARRALLRLSAADRRVLLERPGEGPSCCSPRLEHRAAALGRLLRAIRVGRRSPRETVAPRRRAARR